MQFGLIRKLRSEAHPLDAVALQAGHHQVVELLPLAALQTLALELTCARAYGDAAAAPGDLLSSPPAFQALTHLWHFAECIFIFDRDTFDYSRLWRVRESISVNYLLLRHLKFSHLV